MRKLKTSNKKEQLKTLFKDVGSKIAQIQPGKEIEGPVIQKSKSRIFVDLSPWGTGVIYRPELKGMISMLKSVQIGDLLKAKVISQENEQGLIELSLKEIGAKAAWEKLQKLFQENEIFKARVMSANKGGLMIQAEGIMGFLPASQLGPEHYPRVENGDAGLILKKLQALEGQDLEVKILDLDPSSQKLIFSERAAEEGELKKAISKYKVGDIVEGEVTGVVDFGAFVKFDKNLEGLVHISELGWKLIEDPRQFIKVGKKVKAKIIDISDTQVSLSLKALKKNPWENVERKYKIDKVYPGKVTKINPFGAFVYLDNDIHGLAHISQFGSQEKMKKALKIGKTYKFKVASIKPVEHRMSLRLVKE